MVSLNRDGLTLTYSRTGAGPAVALVQGVGVTGNGWAPQSERLASRFTVIAIDNRGIGRDDSVRGRINHLLDEHFAIAKGR